MNERKRIRAAQAPTTPKPPSETALVAARAMRRFDLLLDDREIETIARGIDANVAAGAKLNPKIDRLHNADEPVTSFTVREA